MSGYMQKSGDELLVVHLIYPSTPVITVAIGTTNILGTDGTHSKLWWGSQPHDRTNVPDIMLAFFLANARCY